MKFIYIDESGKSKEEDFLVLTGISKRLIDGRFVYKKSNKSRMEEIYFDSAPDCLKNIYI